MFRNEQSAFCRLLVLFCGKSETDRYLTLKNIWNYGIIEEERIPLSGAEKRKDIQQMKLKKKNTAAVLLLLVLAIGAIALIPKLSKSKVTETDGQSIPVTQIKTESADSADVQTKPPLSGKYLSDVPHIYQEDKYPTGCESVSAVSLLQYHGCAITVEDFIDNYLPKTDYPYYEGNKMFGDNPWDAFIGDPYSSSGYGCYSTAIVKAMQSAAPENFTVSAVYNCPLQTLFENYVKKGYPVQIWATIEMQEIKKSYTWQLPDGNSFTFVSPEHSLLLIGADDANYYFSDSMRQDAVVSYPKEKCDAAYAALHSQAIVVIPT